MLTILAILFGLLTGGLILGLVLDDLLLRRLRARHPDLWQALGSPDRVFDDEGLAGRRAVRRLYRAPELRLRCSPEVLVMVERAGRPMGEPFCCWRLSPLAILPGVVGQDAVTAEGRGPEEVSRAGRPRGLLPRGLAGLPHRLRLNQGLTPALRPEY